MQRASAMPATSACSVCSSQCLQPLTLHTRRSWRQALAHSSTYMTRNTAHHPWPVCCAIASQCWYSVNSPRAVFCSRANSVRWVHEHWIEVPLEERPRERQPEVEKELVLSLKKLKTEK